MGAPELTSAAPDLATLSLLDADFGRERMKWEGEEKFR